MFEDQNTIDPEWQSVLSAGIKWEDAKDLARKRQERADAVARRLLGKLSNCDRNMHQPQDATLPHKICGNCWREVWYDTGTSTWKKVRPPNG